MSFKGDNGNTRKRKHNMAATKYARQEDDASESKTSSEHNSTTDLESEYTLSDKSLDYVSRNVCNWKSLLTLLDFSRGRIEQLAEDNKKVADAMIIGLLEWQKEKIEEGETSIRLEEHLFSALKDSGNTNIAEEIQEKYQCIADLKKREIKNNVSALKEREESLVCEKEDASKNCNETIDSLDKIEMEIKEQYEKFVSPLKSKREELMAEVDKHKKDTREKSDTYVDALEKKEMTLRRLRDEAENDLCNHDASRIEELCNIIKSQLQETIPNNGQTLFSYDKPKELSDEVEHMGRVLQYDLHEVTPTKKKAITTVCCDYSRKRLWIGYMAETFIARFSLDGKVELEQSENIGGLVEQVALGAEGDVLCTRQNMEDIKRILGDGTVVPFCSTRKYIPVTFCVAAEEEDSVYAYMSEKVGLLFIHHEPKSQIWIINSQGENTITIDKIDNNVCGMTFKLGLLTLLCKEMSSSRHLRVMHIDKSGRPNIDGYCIHVPCSVHRGGISNFRGRLHVVGDSRVLSVNKGYWSDVGMGDKGHLSPTCLSVNEAGHLIVGCYCGTILIFK